MVGNVLEEEFFECEQFVHGADWVYDMECEIITSSSIRVAFVENKRNKSVEKKFVSREAWSPCAEILFAQVYVLVGDG